MSIVLAAGASPDSAEPGAGEAVMGEEDEVETKKMMPSKPKRSLSDVLYIVSTLFHVEGNACLGLNKSFWGDTRIWMAVVDKEHLIVKKNGGSTTKFVCTRLMIASMRGRVDVVQRLLGLGANIKAKCSRGNAALAYACITGQTEVASLLLDRKADIDACNNDNEPALWFACHLAHVETARLLLTRGANVELGGVIIHSCRHVLFDDRNHTDMETLWSRRVQIVGLLAEHNANLNIKTSQGTTPLMLAVKSNQPEVVQLLLEKHVDIEALNRGFKSALWFASYYARVDIVRLLLAAGANVNPTLGDSPFIVACTLISEEDRAEADLSTLWSCRLQVVRLMADHNANVSVANSNGWTALIHATRQNQPEIVNLLIERHVKLNALNHNNMSALWFACYWARHDIARLLLAAGASPMVGDPPILIACRDVHNDHREEMDMATLWSRRLRIIHLLVDHNANLNAADDRGRTCLMHAIRWFGDPAIIELLLDGHVEIDQLDHDGRSALFHASLWANVDAVRLLLLAGADVNLSEPIIAASSSPVAGEELSVMDIATFWHRRLQVVCLLADHNADLSIRNANGNTALELAAAMGQKDIFTFLLTRSGWVLGD